MRPPIGSLLKNLAAGARLALFMPASRLAFRIDVAQLLLLLLVSSLIDFGTDWVRYGDEGYFTWLGLGNEVFGAGLLLVLAAVLALMFREPTLWLGIPVLMLSAFPVLQIVRLVPYVAEDLLPVGSIAGVVFDGVMILWVFALSLRVVAVALDLTGRRRWWRALVGALVLVAPIWFVQTIAPNDSWWKEASVYGIDPRYPNPASEPVLTAQRKLLDDALSDLDDERSSTTDLYFVAFAGDAREDVFRKDVLAAQRVMDERWGTDGRSIALINNPRTLLDTPMATVSNLRETLNEIGSAIDVEQDVVMVYLASHGSRDHVLEVSLPPLELAPLTAPALRGLLDAAGIKWRIVVVSACYSGGFIDALKDDYTLVLTASQSDRASFGCGNRSESTFFGEALFQEGLAQSDSMLDAFTIAKSRVAEREQNGGFKPPSNPQIYVGPAMEEKLKELDRKNTARRNGRSV